MVENEAMGEAMTMLIDFDFLPIRCKFCLKSFHWMKDYLNLASLKVKSMKMGETCKWRNKNVAIQGEGTRVAGGDTHKDGVDHLMFRDPKIGSSKK